MKVKAKHDIPAYDARNFSGRDIPKGTELTVFVGPTYGCIDRDLGAAFTFSDDPHEGPFFELPKSYVTVDGKDSF